MGRFSPRNSTLPTPPPMGTVQRFRLSSAFQFAAIAGVDVRVLSS
jgi:hypothetical protein